MRAYIASLLAFLLVAASSPLAAQELRGITEDGRKLILSPDGTWRFDKSAPAAASGSDSPYQAAVKRFSLSFNTSEWVMLPRREADGTAKRSFKHRTLPLYGMVISDEMPTVTPPWMAWTFSSPVITSRMATATSR